MKKKISVWFCMLALVLCFTGCSSSKEMKTEYDQEGTEQVTEFLIEYCDSADQVMIDEWKKMSDFAMDQQITSAGLPVTKDSFLGALEAWQAAEKENGAYVEHDDYVYEVSGDELKVTTKATFEDREANITFIFDEKSYLNSVTIDAQYTKSEILKKAGLNTLLGMGTVFAVLITISLIISLFRFIPAIQNVFAKKPKGESKEEMTSIDKMQDVPQIQNAADDSELIAVIAAAIAAVEGTTTDGFVVRSIKRRSTNRWN